MADPLAICASVAGLATLGFQITKALSDFIGDVKGAPEEFLALAGETSGLAIALRDLESKLERDFKSSSPYPMEFAKDLKAVLNSLKHVFTRIEGYVKQLDTGDRKINTWESLKLALKLKWRENDVTKCLRSVEAYKSTLTIILVITVGYVHSRL
jgi:Fungal N-terminal domain of STAND proteins